MRKPWPERLPRSMRDGIRLATGLGLFFGGPAWTSSALTFDQWREWIAGGMGMQLAGIVILAWLLADRGCPRGLAVALAVVSAPLSTLPALLDLVEGPVHLRGWPVEPAAARRSCIEDHDGALSCVDGPLAECGEGARELVTLPHLDVVLAHRCSEGDERRLYGGWSEMWREGATALSVARAMDDASRAAWATSSVEADARTLFGILDALESRDTFYLPALEQLLARSDWLAVIAARRLWTLFPEQAVEITERVLAADLGAAGRTLRQKLEEHRAAHP